MQKNRKKDPLFEKTSVKRDSETTQILELAEKHFKKTIINMFQDFKNGHNK